MKLRALTIVCALPLTAADPPGFAYWSSAELKGLQQKLAPKIDGTKFASQQLARYGNHYMMVAHREGNGQAELHKTDADLFVVESGNATLVVGGKIQNPKDSAANEVRGPGIEGGTKHALAAGDIVHIPAKTPHQLQIEAGKEFTYFTLKVMGQQ
jgi:mannose-6-phosphate isomerase-like protein (cupin superfamily)